MFKQKIVITVIIFSLLCQSLLAGGLIRKGEHFVAKQDVRWFTVKESRQLLGQINKVERLEKQIAILKERENQYSNQIVMLKDANHSRKLAMDACNEAVVTLKSAMTEIKSVNQMYKDVVVVQQKIVEKQGGQITSIKKSRRRRTMLSYIAGFLTPLAGAYAVGQIGHVIKF